MIVHGFFTELAVLKQRFRACPVDAKGAIEGPSIDLLAASEADALREAHARLGAQRVEVWTGTRRLVDAPRS